MELIKNHKCFEGYTQFWEHDSVETKSKMRFSTFIPSGKIKGCIIWLSGLTCTEENFITKAGCQKILAEEQLMIICPDTSPRGLNLPGEHDREDFGSGAGFYVDATTEHYGDHYRMYSYITCELYDLIESKYGMRGHIALMGHSMGGHGALIMGLRESEKFCSISAFAPIANPSKILWGQNAFQGYLGNDKEAWKAYDAYELILSGKTHKNKILIDQGTEDSFLTKSLQTEKLQLACDASEQGVEIRWQNGYDHSYYFISTFIADHIKFHAGHVGK